MALSWLSEMILNWLGLLDFKVNVNTVMEWVDVRNLRALCVINKSGDVYHMSINFCSYLRQTNIGNILKRKITNWSLLIVLYLVQVRLLMSLYRRNTNTCVHILLNHQFDNTLHIPICLNRKRVILRRCNGYISITWVNIHNNATLLGWWYYMHSIWHNPPSRSSAQIIL